MRNIKELLYWYERRRHGDMRRWRNRQYYLVLESFAPFLKFTQQDKEQVMYIVKKYGVNLDKKANAEQHILSYSVFVFDSNRKRPFEMGRYRFVKVVGLNWRMHCRILSKLLKRVMSERPTNRDFIKT